MGLFITYHQNVFPMESWDSWGAYVVMDVFLLSRVLSHSVICMNLLCSLVIKSNLQLVRFSSLTGVTLIFIILCLVPGNEYTGSSRFAGRQTVQCKGHWNTARIPAFWHFLYHLQVPDAEIMLKQLRFGETFPDLAAGSRRIWIGMQTQLQGLVPFHRPCCLTLNCSSLGCQDGAAEAFCSSFKNRWTL